MMPTDDQPIATGPLRLTFPELADRLGITVEALRSRVRRRGWPVSEDNHKRKLVTVWPHELETELDRSSLGHRPNADQMSSVSADTFTELLTDLREAHDRETKAREHETATLTALLADLGEARDREAAARDRETEALAKAAVAEQRAAVAEARITEIEKRLAREKEEVERLRKPWWMHWLPTRSSPPNAKDKG